jgi:hypothetical protein
MKKVNHPFYLSIEKYRQTLTFAQEEPKTHHELQKIPEEIQKLRGELHRIRTLMEAKLGNEQAEDEE